MSTHTTPAASAAMPASLKTRRAALGALASLPALVMLRAAAALDDRLRGDVANMPARTVPGLLAKLAAVAEAFGLEALEEETTFKDGETVGFDGAARTILRDCARMGPRMSRSPILSAWPLGGLSEAANG
jgi:hypothetical protein